MRPEFVILVRPSATGSAKFLQMGLKGSRAINWMIVDVDSIGGC